KPAQSRRGESSRTRLRGQPAEGLEVRRGDDQKAGRPEEDPGRIVPHDALSLGVLIEPPLIVTLSNGLRDQQLDLRVPVVAGRHARGRPLRSYELSHLL